MRRITEFKSDHAVFLLLVAIAVVGRMGRPDWNFTPVAAAALFAGFYFQRRWIAALVPLAALAISDFAEPVHNNAWVQLTVWTALMLPAMLGPWLGSPQPSRLSGKRTTAAALAPSAVFFAVTNFAVWATGSGLSFSRDAAGLMECYAVALPFYINMLAGDLFYTGLLFGAWAAIGGRSRADASARA